MLSCIQTYRQTDNFLLWLIVELDYGMDRQTDQRTERQIDRQMTNKVLIWLFVETIPVAFLLVSCLQLDLGWGSGQANRQIDRQMDRQCSTLINLVGPWGGEAISGQTNGTMDRQTDRQTNNYTCCFFAGVLSAVGLWGGEAWIAAFFHRFLA